MKKYAKIKDNSLEYAPRNKGNVSNWINDEKAVLAEGYLPVELQDIPEGKYQVGYEVVNNMIVRKLENVPELEPLTKEEVEQIRRQLYVIQVDPITAHINRLRDEELTPEVAAEIAKLIEERKVLVDEIKINNPYPAEPVVEEVEEPVEVEPVVEDLSEESSSDVVELYSMEI